MPLNKETKPNQNRTNHIKQRLGFYQISPYHGEHQTKRKQNQNRKQIEKTFFHSVLPYFLKSFPFPFPYHFTSSPYPPQLQPRHHHIDNFLQHHIIVNIFLMKQDMSKPLSSKPFHTFSNQLPKIYLHLKN